MIHIVKHLKQSFQNCIALYKHNPEAGVALKDTHNKPKLKPKPKSPEHAEKKIGASKAELLKRVSPREETKAKFDKEHPHFKKYQKLKMPDGSEITEDKLKKMDTGDFMKIKKPEDKLSLITK
jgi:hypothetical protein